MSTQTNTQVIQWQNLKVLSDFDVVRNLAQQKGWEDCQIFGHGDMITQPMQSQGWNLIPADLYEYSIPAKGVDRLLQIIDAGVHIQGVIIADDTRRVEPKPAPTRPMKPLPSEKTVFSIIGKVLIGLIVLSGIVLVAAFVVIKGPLFILCSIFGLSLLHGVTNDFDPQLIILVDDGNGGTAWLSVLTWYD